MGHGWRAGERFFSSLVRVVGRAVVIFSCYALLAALTMSAGFTLSMESRERALLFDFYFFQLSICIRDSR